LSLTGFVQGPSFVIDTLIGRSWLNASLPDPWIVTRITANGRDITDNIIDAADGDLNDVVIRIAKGGRVTGKVTDRNGRVVPAFVVAFPDDERWRMSGGTCGRRR
jgi:hypothetical protein